MSIDDEIRQHLDRVVRTARTFARKGVRYDDAYADGLIGLWKALKDYDPAKGPFGPYAHRRITGEILDGYAAASGCHRVTQVTLCQLGRLPDVLPDEHDGISDWWAALEQDEQAGADAEKLALIYASIDRESPRNQEVIRAYLSGRSFAAIATDYGFTDTRANQIVRRWMKRLNPDVPQKALGYHGRKKAA